MTEKNMISVFYACDDCFARYTAVSLHSLAVHADPRKQYRIHILHAGLSEQTQRMLLEEENAGIHISFDDVTTFMATIEDHIPLRDYYSATTYYRLFIPEMFSDLDRAVYLDSDTVLLCDVAELYAYDPGTRYVSAAHDQVMVQTDVFGRYAEEVVGIDRHAFFNAGVLVINCAAFRRAELLDQFSALVREYRFIVTQDEDYLNVLCKDQVRWLPQTWNALLGVAPACREEEIKLLHYNMVAKPWHYRDCALGHVFWRYAEQTSVGAALHAELEGYTDAQREEDSRSGERLVQTALSEIAREDNFLRRRRCHQAPDRVAVLEKIAALEAQGIFDRDVEDDPPARLLKANEIEYIRRRPADRFQTELAFAMARRFVRQQMRQKNLIIRDIVGASHFAALHSGAVITCNHFNAFDSFAIHLAYDASGQKERRLYRVIREGNYTSFPGFYGYLMRHCDTLPLSSSPKTMAKFIRAVNTLLQEGHFVLFYPEQSMWWNYRKPKPLKDGAFNFAARNHVPILPCFITMQDSQTQGQDGFPVQEYTIHIGAPLWPDPGKNDRENTILLRERNAAVWRRLYEQEYDMPLVYRTATLAPARE